MNTCPADIFQAIADPSRREILQMLARNKQSIGSIANCFHISRPAVSKHIKVLEQAGFITIEASGRERFCVLNKEGFDSVTAWAASFHDHRETRQTAPGKALKKHYKHASVI